MGWMKTIREVQHMSSSHRIIVNSVLSAATLEGKISPQNNKRQMLENIGQYFMNVAQGNETAKINIHGSGVLATNLITLSSHVATDYLTLNGVTLTCVASGATPTSVQYKEGASDEATANNIYTMIEACTTAKILGIIKAYRRATIAFSSFVSTDYLTINGVVFTGKTSPTSGNNYQFAIGATDTRTCANFVKCLNASTDNYVAKIVSATASSGTATIIYDGELTVAASAHATVASKGIKLDCMLPGAVGNLCTLAISAHGTVTGANFASGSDGNEYTWR